VATEIEVTHNEAAQRFEALVDGRLCRCDYRLAGAVMQIVHTEVPPQLQGRGMAARLVRAALAHAQTRGLKVLPLCSYVRAYMQRHPQTHGLRA
jgi:hypothetical protein